MPITPATSAAPRGTLLACLLALAACSTAGAPDEGTKVAGDQYVDGQLIVRFHDGVSHDRVLGLVTRNGDEVLSYEINANRYVIRIDGEVEEAVRLYTVLEEVEYSEPNYIREEREDDQ